MSDTRVTTVDLLRHGETTRDDILRGRTDVTLSSRGYVQMQRRLEPIIAEGLRWQYIVSSPLVRCAQFARDLSEQLRIETRLDDGFLEMDFGDWDGRSIEALQSEMPELFANIWRDPEHYHAPGGESFSCFSARIRDAWHTLLAQFSGKHILLICHGGVIRSVLGHVLQAPLTALSRIDVPYACLSRIKIYEQAGSECWPQLVFHNP